MRVPYVNTTVAEDIRTTLYLVPLWWLLGLGLIIFHAVSLLIFFKVAAGRTARGRRLRLPGLALWLVPFLLLYGLSISLNAGAFGQLRVLAGVYNLSYWIMGLLLMISLYNALEVDDLSTFARPLAFVLATAGGLSILALLLWIFGAHSVRLPTPFQALLPETLREPLAVWSTQMSILVQDWFSGTAWPRTSVYSPYPTALAAVVVMSVPMLLWVRRNSARSGSRAWYTVAVSLGCFALLMTWSRSSVAALMLGLMLHFVVVRRMAVVAVLAGLLATVLVLPFISEFMAWVGALRAGSTETRFDLYEYTARFVLERSPLLGLGIKPRISDFYIPVGSHSMYVGMLLKSGLLGLFAFLTWLLAIFVSWVTVLRYPLNRMGRSYSAALGASIFALVFWMLFEDLDAPQLVAFVYFIQVGCLAVFLRHLRVEFTAAAKSRGEFLKSRRPRGSTTRVTLRSRLP